MDDIREWYKLMKRLDFRITPAEFDRASLFKLSPTLRALTYSALANGKGKSAQALGFARMAKGLAATDAQRAYTLYLYGFFLSAAGDHDAAINAQHDCVNLCYAIRNKELASDALLHLSSMYAAIGNALMAKEYEKEASLVLYAW